MTNETIDPSNESSVEWDENCFRFCDFENLSKNGGIVSSTFVSCSFRNIEWYWGIFTHAAFLQCTFENCTFRGTSFADSRFVECDMGNSVFRKDNLNADCDFSRAIAYNTKTNSCIGFGAEEQGAPKWGLR